MTTITVRIADSLYQQAESLAAERGESVEALAQGLIEEYLQELEDVAEAREILARVKSGEEPTYSHEEVWAEIEELEHSGELPT